MYISTTEWIVRARQNVKISFSTFVKKNAIFVPKMGQPGSVFNSKCPKYHYWPGQVECGLGESCLGIEKRRRKI